MSATAPARPGAIRSPIQARQRANELDAGTSATDAERADHLRQWATARQQAAARERSGMLEAADDAHSRAEHHRQALADLDVVVPTRAELEARPATGHKSGTPGTGRPSSAARRGPSRKGAPPQRIARKAANATGVPGWSGWGIASSIFVGSIGLILLSRLIDTNKGGPQVVQAAASGVSRLVDLVVQPVDPFASAAPKAATTTTTTAGTPAMTSPGSTPVASSSSTPTK